MWLGEDLRSQFSNLFLQVHLKERMHALEEKNNLSNELTAVKKKLEDFGNQKVRLITLPASLFKLVEYANFPQDTQFLCASNVKLH